MYCRFCGIPLNGMIELCESCGKSRLKSSIQLYKELSIGELLKFGWNIFKANPWASILIAVIIALSLFSPDTESGFFIALVLSFFSQLWLTKIALSVPDNSFKFDLKLFFSNPSKIFHFFIVTFLYLLAVVIGSFLILPGIYLAIRFSLVQFLILDEQCSVTESFKKSWALTQGYEFFIFKWLIVSSSIIIIGALSLIGGIVAFPVIIYSEYFLYKKLKHGN